jgi:hypothetical protein
MAGNIALWIEKSGRGFIGAEEGRKPPAGRSDNIKQQPALDRAILPLV